MPEQFMCKNSECVHESQRCDGKADCSDETDEFDCGGKASDNFWAVVLLLRQCFFNVQYQGYLLSYHVFITELCLCFCVVCCIIIQLLVTILFSDIPCLYYLMLSILGVNMVPCLAK